MTDKREQISGLIVGYLSKHPEAQDTLEGITAWWLTFEITELSTRVVADALEDLVRQGIVAARMCGEGTTLYNLNPSN